MQPCVCLVALIICRAAVCSDIASRARAARRSARPGTRDGPCCASAGRGVVHARCHAAGGRATRGGRGQARLRSARGRRLPLASSFHAPPQAAQRPSGRPSRAMPAYRTPFNGYSVRFSPFVQTRLAVATSQVCFCPPGSARRAAPPAPPRRAARLTCAHSGWPRGSVTSRQCHGGVTCSLKEAPGCRGAEIRSISRREARAARQQRAERDTSAASCAPWSRERPRIPGRGQRAARQPARGGAARAVPPEVLEGRGSRCLQALQRWR